MNKLSATHQQRHICSLARKWEATLHRQHTGQCSEEVKENQGKQRLMVDQARVAGLTSDQALGNGFAVGSIMGLKLLRQASETVGRGKLIHVGSRVY